MVEQIDIESKYTTSVNIDQPEEPLFEKEVDFGTATDPLTSIGYKLEELRRGIGLQKNHLQQREAALTNTMERFGHSFENKHKILLLIVSMLLVISCFYFYHSYVLTTRIEEAVKLQPQVIHAEEDNNVTKEIFQHMDDNNNRIMLYLSQTKEKENAELRDRLDRLMRLLAEKQSVVVERPKKVKSKPEKKKAKGKVSSVSKEEETDEDYEKAVRLLYKKQVETYESSHKEPAMSPAETKPKEVQMTPKTNAKPIGSKGGAMWDPDSGLITK